MSEEKRGPGRPRKVQSLDDAFNSSEIVTTAREVEPEFDSSALEYDEIFNYLGRQYVKKPTLNLKLDKDGEPVERHSRTAMGMRFDRLEYERGKSEFFSITSVPKTNPVEMEDFGRPLTVERRLSKNPIAPEKVFIQTDESITYERDDYKKKYLKVEGRKLVEYTSSGDVEL